MKGVCRDIGEGGWFVAAMGVGFGLLWAIVSMEVGVNWWDGFAPPPWEALLRGVLLWPVVAGFVVSGWLPGSDPVIVIVAIGLATGGGTGLSFALYLAHRDY